MHFLIQNIAKINLKCIYKKYFDLSKQNKKSIFKNMLNCEF